MKQYPRIVEKVFYEPWLISPSAYSSIVRVIESKLMELDFKEFGYATGTTTNGTVATTTNTTGATESIEFKGTQIVTSMDAHRIGMVPIQGILAQRIGGIERMSGGTDYLDIQRESQKLLDQGARGLLFAFDSPGGAVRGCPELAKWISGLSIPTMAFTDSKASSAAYWLASACDQIVATESSDVGSIGVILPWVDKTKMWDMMGTEYKSFVNEGAVLKGLGGGPGSLSAEQSEHIQETLNFVGEEFQKFVGSHRENLNQKEVFKAGTYFGKQALEVGLVDAVGGYDDAYRMLRDKVDSGRYKAVKSSVPAPMKVKAGNKMSTGTGNTVSAIEQLRADNPELYEQLMQEQQSALSTARNAAAEAERLRLSALDELAFSDECRGLVAQAKKDGKQASEIGVQIAKILAADNEALRTQVGVLKGMEPAKGIASIDPNTREHKTGAEDTSDRLKAYFNKRYSNSRRS